ncbi:YncE family protein [Macrococcus animalis]|uniref:YncE family protein n=1 Tax=Macrococcus animalis TaxID=3395467 RepID=UPI0039BDDA4A
MRWIYMLLLSIILLVSGCGVEDKKEIVKESSKNSATKTEQTNDENKIKTPKITKNDITTDQIDKNRSASNTTTMKLIDTISEGPITPKSVVANNKGSVIANNMMYQHTITVYDAKSRKLVKKLSDTVDFNKYGIEGFNQPVSGAPVEAVWTKDGKFAYVSQYQLTDHGAEAEDMCSAGKAIAESVVYRYNAEKKDWDQVIQVGRVPKYVALTQDDSKLLVSNWCDKSLSVVDTKTAKETEQIPLNAMPRGIVSLPDNKTAYVTAMFSNEIYKVDLASGKSKMILQTGQRPRHLVLDDKGKTIYITVAGANELLKYDVATDKVIGRATTGKEPRSMAISPDSTAVYIVNYDENTVSKFDTKTLKEITRVDAGVHPIGITYENTTGDVWVANYGGTISVYDDKVVTSK